MSNIIIRKEGGELHIEHESDALVLRLPLGENGAAPRGLYLKRIEDYLSAPGDGPLHIGLFIGDMANGDVGMSVYLPVTPDEARMLAAELHTLAAAELVG